LKNKEEVNMDTVKQEEVKEPEIVKVDEVPESNVKNLIKIFENK
jgi:hypothetical protein